MAKITDIQQQKKNNKRFSVFIDEEFFAGVDAFIVYKYGLKIGEEVNKGKLKKMIFEDHVEKAKGYVIDYLLHKSKKEVRGRLKEKEYEEEVIEEVMNFIEKYNILDDLELAKKIVNDGIHIKNNGVKQLRMKLKMKGIDDEKIDIALSQIDSDNQIENARKELNKKIDGYERKSKGDKFALKQRCFRFLMGKGFETDVISQVVSEFIED